MLRLFNGLVTYKVPSYLPTYLPTLHWQFSLIVPQYFKEKNIQKSQRTKERERETAGTCPIKLTAKYFDAGIVPHIKFCIGPVPALFLFIFVLFNTVDIYKTLPVTGFEPRTSGVGSICFTNWGTTPGQIYIITNFHMLKWLIRLHNGFTKINQYKLHKYLKYFTNVLMQLEDLHLG